MRATIIRLIKQRPGLSVRDIAKKIRMKIPATNYNLGQLIKEEQISRYTDKGLLWHYY
jgi:DNA-binding MarR family transcriptional regulator